MYGMSGTVTRSLVRTSVLPLATKDGIVSARLQEGQVGNISSLNIMFHNIESSLNRSIGG